MQVLSALAAEIAGSRGEQAGDGAFDKGPSALPADRLESLFRTEEPWSTLQRWQPPLHGSGQDISR